MAQDEPLHTITLTADELEAALLGANWVMERGDPMVAAGAKALMAKLARQVPVELRPLVREVHSNRREDRPAATFDPSILRTAIKRQQKIRMVYRAKPEKRGAIEEITRRVVWPLMIAHVEEVRVLIAWCETREGFRHFRVDRIEGMNILDAHFPIRRDRLLADWKQQQEKTGFRAQI